MTPLLDEATARLTDTLSTNQCVYLIERRRSRTNETAIVDFVIVTPTGAIASIGRDVAAVCHVSYDSGLNGATVRRPQTAEQFVTRLAGELHILLTAKWL